MLLTNITLSSANKRVLLINITLSSTNNNFSPCSYEIFLHNNAYVCSNIFDMSGGFVIIYENESSTKTTKYWLACIFSVCIIACTNTWFQHVSKLYLVCEKLSIIFLEFYFLTYPLILTGNYYYYYYLKKAKGNKEN